MQNDGLIIRVHKKGQEVSLPHTSVDGCLFPLYPSQVFLQNAVNAPSQMDACPLHPPYHIINQMLSNQ